MSNPIKALFLDMDGVLWRDLSPIGDLAANLARITDLGFHTAFITNNATRSKIHYIDIFAGFGIDIDESQLYTSAFTTALTLSTEFPEGGPLYVVGESGLHAALTNQGFTHSDEDQPLAVVVGLDRNVTYEQLKQATLHIRAGVPFIATNPDKTLPTPEGLVPGAGALVTFLETASGQSARVIGKPQPAMLQQALTDLDLQPGQALMVGDRLETDIAAGQNAACPAALVLSGASAQADLEAWPQQPQYVAPDLAALLDQLA